MKTFLFLPLLLLAFLMPDTAHGQGGSVNTVQNVAELVSRPPSLQNPNVQVLGYYGTADWGNARRFVTTTNPPTTITNQAHVIRSVANPAMYYVSEDRSNPKQDLRWWGPTTNGVGTAHIALREAATWLTNGGTILLAPQRFKFGALVIITNNVSLEGSDRDSTILDFTEAAIATNAPCIRWQGSTVATNIVIADLPAGTNKVVLSAPPPPLAVGEIFVLHSTNDWSYPAGRSYYHAGQFGTVLSVSGNEVRMMDSIIENISATTFPTANALHFVKLAPITASARNFTVIAYAHSIGLEFQVSRDCVVEDVKAWGTDYTGVFFNVAYNTHVSRVVMDWDSDTIVGLNYGVIFGAAEYVDLSECFLRTGRHGADTGGSSFGIPNSFIRFRDSTISSTKDGDQFGAAFHENIRYSSYKNCDLPQGIAFGGNHVEIIGNRIVNIAGAAAISAASQGANLGADYRIEGNDITVRNGTMAASIPAVRILWSPQAVTGSGSPVGIDTNTWAGTNGDKDGDWLRVLNNKVRFVDPITKATYGFFIDEPSSLNDTNRFRKALFGGIEFRGNIFSYNTNQAFADLGTIDLVGLYLQTRSNLTWKSWIVEDNDFGALGIRAVGAAKDFRINRNRFDKVLYHYGAMRLEPNFFAYDNVSDLEIRGNTLRNLKSYGIFIQDWLGTATLTDNTIEDWGSLTTGYGVYINYSGVNQAWSSNSLKRVSMERNTYLSDRSSSVTTATIVAAPGGEVHKLNENFKGFAVDGTGGNLVSFGLPEVVSYRTNNTRTTLPFRPGALTSAQQIQIFNADDGSLAWDSTGTNLIQSVGGVWKVVGAGAGGGAVTVDTVAALKGLIPSAANVNVLVLGYYNKGDWGSPRIFSATTAASTPNLGNVFQNINQPSVYYVAWDRLAPEQDVRWWGAIPNDARYEGTNIQAAIDYVQSGSAGTRVLNVPAGGYNLRDGETPGGGLLITNTMTLKGAHRQSTIFNYIGTSNTLTIGPVNWVPASTNTPVIQGVEVRDIFFYGNWDTNSSVQNHVKIRGATHGIIEDCQFSNAPIGNAIYMEEGAWIWDIHRCSIGYADVGIKMLAQGASGSIVSATHITGGEIAACHWGILTGTTTGPPGIFQNTRLHANIWITDTTIEGNGDDYRSLKKDGGGIWLNAAESVNIEGIYTEANPVDIRLGSLAATNALSCMNINISQVRFADSTNGVQIYSATGVSLDNNWFLQGRSTNIVVATANVVRSTVGTGNVSSANTNNCPTIHDPLGLLTVDLPCGSGPGSGTGGSSGTIVRTIADLRNVIPSPATSNVLVMGYYTPGDWGAWRRFSQVTPTVIASTNLGNYFANVNQPTISYVSEDRNAINQDARWFGVQPGPPNCSVQLQAAADYCKKFDIYGISYGKTLVINGDPAWYILTNSVNLECSFDLSQAYFVASVTNIGGTNALPVFVVGNTNTNLGAYAYSGLVGKFPNGIESTMPPYTVGVGVQIIGVTKSEFHLGTITRFKTGMRAVGTFANSLYNNFYGGLLFANKNNLIIESDPAGGAFNANNFYGLSLNSYNKLGTDPTTLTNGYECIIINGEPGTGSINGNQFFGTSFEGFASSRFISLTNISGVKFESSRIESHVETYPIQTNQLNAPYVQVTATRQGVGWDNEFDFTQVVGGAGGNRWPWILETSVQAGVETSSLQWAGGNKVSTPNIRMMRGNLSTDPTYGMGHVFEHSRFPNQSLFSFYPFPVGTNNAITDPGRWTLAIADNWLRTKGSANTNQRFELSTANGNLSYYNPSNIDFKLLNESDGKFRLRSGSHYGSTSNNTFGFSAYGFQSGSPSSSAAEYDLIISNTNNLYRQLQLGVYPENFTPNSALRGWSTLFTGGPYGTASGMQGLKLMTGNSDEQIVHQIGFVSQPQFALTGSQATFAGVNVATTRDFNASNLISQSLTLVPYATTNTPKFADATTQLFGYQIANNSPLSWQIQNANAGNAATVSLNLAASGAVGSIGVFPTTYSSGTYQGRTRIHNSANGIIFSLPGASLPDLKIEFSTNNALTMSAILTDIQTTTTKLKAAPGSPAFILGTVADPQFNSQNLVTIPVSSLGGGGGIGDAPTNGTPYGRQDGAWTALNPIYGRLGTTNLWTGTSNLFTGRVVAQGELNASNLIGNSLSLGTPWTIGQGVSANATTPIYAAQSSQNAQYQWWLQNANGGDSANTRLTMVTPTANGSLYVYPTTSSLPGFAGRTVLDNSARGFRMVANAGDFRIDAGGDVDNLIVTNGQTTLRNNLNASNILVRTISLSPTMLTTTAPFANSTIPIYATTDSGNVAIQYFFQNANSGVAAVNRITSSTFGVTGYLGTYPIAYASNPLLAERTTVENNKKGVTILPLTGDFRVNFNTAVLDALILTNNLLTINADTTKLRAAAGSPTYILGTVGDPSSSALNVVTIPVGSLGGGGGITDAVDSNYYLRQMGAWANAYTVLDNRYGLIPASNLWSGNSNTFSAAVQVGGEFRSPGTGGQYTFKAAPGADASGQYSIAIGRGSVSSQTSTVALGDGAGATAASSVSIGVSAYTSGSSSVSLGNGANDNGFANSVALGAGAQVSQSFQIRMGGSSHGVSVPGLLQIKATTNNAPTHVAAFGSIPTTGPTEVQSMSMQNFANYISPLLTVTGGGAGTKTFYRFRYLDNVAPVANAAVIDTRNTTSPVLVLSFNDTTDEYAVFESVVPEGITLTSITCRLFVAASSASAGVMKFGMALNNMDSDDTDVDNWGTEAVGSVTCSSTNGKGVWLTITQSSFSSITGGTAFRMRIARRPSDTGTDTMSGNAQLIMGELRTQ